MHESYFEMMVSLCFHHNEKGVFRARGPKILIFWRNFKIKKFENSTNFRKYSTVLVTRNKSENFLTPFSLIAKCDDVFVTLLSKQWQLFML
jgi:hypothetical protein